MLESGLRSDNTFLTLTYSDSNLRTGSSEVIGPTNPLLPTLLKKDVQDWLKRLRKAIEPLKIRYFAVGEYGDLTMRPHYHAAVFGYPNCLRGKTRYLIGSDGSQKSCCIHCDLIMDTWGLGAIALGSLTAESSQYIAGYVTKKMTSSKDSRLIGRQPEFSLMSRKPAIGTEAMWDVASTILEFDLDQTQADVPVSLRHGKRVLPLGRTLRNKLRSMVGKEERITQEAFDEYQKTMRPLYEAARNDKNDPSVVSHIKKANKQKIRNLEGKAKLNKKRGSL